LHISRPAATYGQQVSVATIDTFPLSISSLLSSNEHAPLNNFLQCSSILLGIRLRSGRPAGTLAGAPREIVMAAAKKAPNPIDRHVGSRVRMRRMMLAMSQEKLGDALGLTFQQVQKYEKGTNRIGASRLQQISHILQVPVAFFFEGAPNLHSSADGSKEAPSPAYVSDFLATSEGLSLTKAFMRIKQPKLRRRIVDLVEEIAGDED
jgi:transcriptional regulator with XRE-family HTH domain